MGKRLPTIAAAALTAALLALAAPAAARTGVAPAHGFAPHQLVVKFAGDRRGQTVALPKGVGVRAGARALRRSPEVAYAEPNYVATASAAPESEIPNDSGSLEGVAEVASAFGGWALRQWNFLDWEGVSTPGLPTSPGGIDAVGAWRHLEEEGRPGAEGEVVAILDTGVAYRSKGSRYLRSPDFTSGQFAKGYDFVGHDRLPLDTNGHGTHVAGTIAEKTNNGTGLTGLAYRARLMPIRVLDERGVGYASVIAKGIRFAIAHHADVINMSFNFECGQAVPVVDEALREAYAKGIVTVASGGNLDLSGRAPAGAKTCVSDPATGPRVIGVGGTTEGGCLGNYSLAGTAIDLVAPGGGIPEAGCPSVLARPIYQVTLRKDTTNEFSIPSNYVGTSMAAAHVSGVAAMVLASGVLGRQPTPKARVQAVTRRLRKTSRSLGLPATQQGAGLIDAGAATDPAL
jgi:serine protease